ncbi:SDR family oxidoreductase [Methylosinus sp. Sm6]|uniref:SDR family oxidoreductase n=1 Tax=Methylosinus sp. Sm6 TaxID=2866948 RepID=UPI001C9A04BC|nr:SDR family oxidoreductase [Methylosinus sp. Sm6]MBY6241502.1 SDR family oxidoreductase [Methylosinus sp. Sm6]
MDLGIKGRRALILGGSKGIGFRCAELLAAEGADITLAARDGSRLAAAARAISAQAPDRRIEVSSVDIASEDGFQRICSLDSVFDILLIMMARPREIALDALNRADYGEAILAYGANATMIAHHFLGGMIERRFGRIVSVLGTSAKAPDSSHIVSNAARTSHVAAMASLARNVAAQGVTSNCVLAGPTATPTLRKNWERRAEDLGLSYFAYEAQRLERTPAARLGQPSEIAALCAFLCSEHAAFVTGQSIVVDGGAHASLF